VRFKVRFVTTKGEFVVEATRALAPRGVDRFYRLVQIRFFDGAAFFRVVKGFVVQFGMRGNPQVAAAWSTKTIKSDPVRESNRRGYLTHAKSSGPDTRSTQMFINLTNNLPLDQQGFAPFATVVSGMEVVDQLYGGYGEELTAKQPTIQQQGNLFLRREYPRLDYIKSASIVR